MDYSLIWGQGMYICKRLTYVYKSPLLPLSTVRGIITASACVCVCVSVFRMMMARQGGEHGRGVFLPGWSAAAHHLSLSILLTGAASMVTVFPDPSLLPLFRPDFLPFTRRT